MNSSRGRKDDRRGETVLTWLLLGRICLKEMSWTILWIDLLPWKTHTEGCTPVSQFITPLRIRAFELALSWKREILAYFGSIGGRNASGGLGTTSYTSYEGPAAYATTSIRLPSSVPSFHHPLLVHYLLDQITLSWTSPCLSPALSDQNHWRMPTRETRAIIMPFMA